MTLIELLVVALIVLVALTGAVQGFYSISNLHNGSLNVPEAQQRALEVVRIIATEVRSAPSCVTGSYATSPIYSGTSSTLTFFDGCGASPENLWVFSNASGDVTKQLAGGSVNNVAEDTTVTFDYYVGTGTYFSAAELSTLKTTSVAAGSTDASRIIGIGITATATVEGVSASYTTIVRFRNAPGTRSLAE